MIEKFIRITNIGRFANYRASGNVSLEPLTLIYAENGRGKTTLSAILRSVQSGDSGCILERRTLGATADPEAEMLISGANFRFVRSGWDNTFPDLEVFDAPFVHRNVYSGEYVELEHRRNLYRFAIGEQGVQLAKTIDSLDTAIRGKNREIRTSADEIGTHIIGDTPVEEFVTLLQVNDIDAKISAKTAIATALEQAEGIAETPRFEEIKLPDVPLKGFEGLLGKQLQNVLGDAERITKSHMDSCMDEEGEGWLTSGLAYVENESCPFCGQSLTDLELIRAYRAYFSEAYSNLKDEIVGFSEGVEELLSEDALLELQQVIDFNNRLTDFWRDHLAAEYQLITFENVASVLKPLRDMMVGYLARKATAPLDYLKVDDSSRVAADAYSTLISEIVDYNQAIVVINGEIERIKQETSSGDLEAARQDLETLQNQKIRFEPEVRELCDHYQVLVSEKAGLEAQKQDTRVKLDGYTAQLFGRYHEGINRYLDKFGAGLRIRQQRPSYRGGRPSTEYEILINDTAVGLGGPDTPADEPCFRNTVSDGDKSTLAFAFFLARLDQDSNLGNKIVVFDDPISSLDRNRQRFTQQEITRISGVAKQTVVLSHDPFFLRSVYDAAYKNKTKLLQITGSGQGSSIALWDIVLDTQSYYFKNYDFLAKYAEAGGVSTDPERINVARCLRPLLEENLRVRYPRHFKPTDSLGDYIDYITKAASRDPIASLKGVLSDLSAINTFVEYQHGSAGSQPISDVELTAHVSKALDLIRGS